MITLLLAGLIPRVSITVNAEVTLDDFPYKKYFEDAGYYYAIISKVEFEQLSQSANFPPDNYWDFNTGMSTEATNNQNWWCVEGTYDYNTSSYIYPEAYLCTWYPTGWQLRNGWASGAYLCLFPAMDDLTTLPSDFPSLEFESLEEALSKTTSTTNTALTIQSNVGASYSQYQAGQIDLSTLEAGLQSALDQLESLANASGNTLSDQVAVNNAITYTQTIQQITNTENIINTQQINEDLVKLIDQWLNDINIAYEKYTNELGLGNILGRLNQSEAIAEISNTIYKVSSILREGSYKNSSDINAINAVINYANNKITSLQNYNELDSTVAEKSQASDAEELEYLDNLEAETTDNINTLKVKVDSSINQTQADQVKQQIIQPILQNTLLIKILPIAALFMVLAVTLGFKYRL